MKIIYSTLKSARMLPFILLFYGLLVSSFANSGPFGTYAGMALEEFSNSRHAHDYWYIVDVPSPHPGLTRYEALVGKSTGLCYLNALSNVVKYSTYGTQLRKDTDLWRDRLTSKYGPPDIVRNSLSGAKYLEGGEYWMYTLMEGNRTYAYLWTNNLPPEMKTIYVGATAKTQTKGGVVLQYQMSNYLACEEEVSNYGVDNL